MVGDFYIERGQFQKVGGISSSGGNKQDFTLILFMLYRVCFKFGGLC